MQTLRVVGAVLTGVGILIAAFPGWFAGIAGNAEPPTDTFAAIERRVRGGMVLGVGLALVAQSAWRSWSTTVASVFVYFVFGALIARLAGLVLDGNDGRQWMWVAGEGLVVALAAAWLWRSASGG